ncbi:MAG: hypothetical protein HKO68_15465, partial [Desulfobacterales bacterium]|nr:hypothetical protein [Desulfobacterales bacterium]
FGPDDHFSGNAAKVIATQVLWAICTGPLLLMVFKNLQDRLETGFKALYTRKGEQS